MIEELIGRALVGGKLEVTLPLKDWNALLEHIRSLESQREHFAASTQTFKRATEEREAYCQQLEERVKGLESQNDELQKAVISRDERHENSVAHFDRTKRTIFDQQLEIQQLQQRVKEYAHQVGCYESSLANKDAEISDLQQQVRRLEEMFAPYQWVMRGGCTCNGVRLECGECMVPFETTHKDDCYWKGVKP